MGTLPYLKFYVDDWLSDRKVRQLTPEARCLYWDLLSTAWREGGIPADVEELAGVAAWLGFKRSQFNRAWPQIEQFWLHGENGTLRNPRQEREREAAHDAHRKRVEAGRKGGRAK